MYHGKVIYQPSGKAAEYSQWAANFYVGCSARCSYCYCKSLLRGIWSDKPRLKKTLNNNTAVSIFESELLQNSIGIRKHGLFFNFISDPCLPETYQLNYRTWFSCDQIDIPIKILTKQTWWVDEFIKKHNSNKWDISIGFTLTGHDELEPGAAKNHERIEAMKKIHSAGFKTWASVEPVIDFADSYYMMRDAHDYCDLFKIGLQSGKRYDQHEVRYFIKEITENCDRSIYFKDSLLKQSGITRDSLHFHKSNCVTRDFTL